MKLSIILSFLVNLWWGLNILLSYRSSYGKFKAAQVKKILKISTFGIYCNLLEDNMSVEGYPVVTLCNDLKFDLKRYDYLINPFDLTIYLFVSVFSFLAYIFFS